MTDEFDVVGAIDGGRVLHFPETKKKIKPRKRRSAPPPANDDGQDPPESNGGFTVDEMNEEFALVMLGSKSVVLREMPDAPIEDKIRFLAVDGFKNLLANRFTERRQADGKIKMVTHAAAWMSNKERRTYDGVEFFPDASNRPGTEGYLNLYRGFSIEPEVRDGASYAIFKDHVLTNICRGDQALFEWIWAWCAHILQRPRERIGTAVVFRGRTGTGKTKVGQVIGSLIPSHYFLVDDPRYLVGQFNAHMASCLLLQADEGFWAGDKAAEGRLKGLVTAEFQMIESKGVDPIRLRNYVRLLITSNEDWVIPAGKDERRFLVVDVGDHCKENHAYFRDMDAELDAGGRAALLHDLLALDLSKVNLRVIPKTDALLEQKLRSLDPVESWLFERLADGETLKGGSFWESVVNRETWFSDYVVHAQRIGVRRLAEKTAWGMKLRKLFPTLRSKRMTIEGDGDSRRPHAYELPCLEEARSAFELSVGQRVDWGENPNRIGEREQGRDFFDP